MKTRMQLKVAITTRRHTGWRVNAISESDPPEAIIAERAAAVAIDRKRKQLRTKRTLALPGFVFLWLPPLLPVVFFIHGAISGFPMPFRMYPILVLTFRPAANIGSLFLCLASRAAKTLSKPIGWLALALFVFPLVAFALMGPSPFTYNFGHLSRLTDILVLFAMALTLLSLFALNGFSIYAEQNFPAKARAGT